MVADEIVRRLSAVGLVENQMRRLFAACHADFGEVGVAIVIAKAGVMLDGDKLIAALKAQLANFKIPKKCFVVAELPRNTMGKVQKNVLREQHKKLFA